jgi:hypothetical protein
MESNKMESVEKPFIFMPDYLAEFNKKVKEMSNFTDDQMKKCYEKLSKVYGYTGSVGQKITG